MKNTVTILLLIALFMPAAAIHAQIKKKSTSGTLSGKAAIGPLCPHEPCIVSAERLKAVFAAHRVFIYDSNKKIVLKLTINNDSSFTCRLKPGKYMAMVSPAEGNPLNEQLKNFMILRGKTTKLLVEYDTGMR
jgi:uncharacterized GH25 family protein